MRQWTTGDQKSSHELSAQVSLSGSGEEYEDVKSLQTDRLTDGQTTSDQKSSLELSAH